MIMLMVGINFILCTAIAFIAICRLRNSLSTVNKIIRAQYALVVGGSFGCAFQTALFDSYPSEGTLIFVSAVLVVMILDFVQWRHLEKEHELKTSN